MRLDDALRKIWASPDYISDLDLVDFKVRILTSRTNATTRSLWKAGRGKPLVHRRRVTRYWSTHLSSIASSINYKLIHNGATAASVHADQTSRRP